MFIDSKYYTLSLSFNVLNIDFRSMFIPQQLQMDNYGKHSSKLMKIIQISIISWLDHQM